LTLQRQNWPLKKQVCIILIGLLVQLPFQSIRADIGIRRNYDLNQNNTSQQGFGASSPFVPGDAIKVSTFPDSTSFLNRIFPITDRGFILLHIYVKVIVTDMSKTELENFLKEQFRDYLRFPYLEAKPLVRVSVLGGVPRSGFYYFDPDYSLWELIYLVGGATYEEGLKKMKWERNRKTVSGNLIPYLQKGISLKNMGFRSGDQIWVESAGKPTFIEKARNYFSIVTFVAGIFTFYYSYRLFLEGRQTRINIGNSRLR
jgi:hypothetical protein